MAPKRPSGSPAGGDTPDTSGQPQRALTAANLSKCMDLLVQPMKINPNIERSTAVIRGVMEKMTCYEVLLKEKQQKKKTAIDNKLLQTAHTKSSNRIGDRLRQW
ncbi:hypothetical protein E2C01_053835 [Portunus trituberculatus]|uniref:Uncharacterized protein n=1 Tax=Portunus trituberculatus TaxID=210409 RepID=A0A5B7GRJ4_PORTR|nr:hypothetical protein [Portunus trituberculatus]